MGFPKRYDGELRETLFRSQGSQVSMRMAMGSGSLLSRHGMGIGPQDAPKDSQGLSRVAAGNPGFPGLEPVTLGRFSRCLGEFRDTVELGGASRDSSGFGEMEEGLTSRGDRNLMIPLHFGL